MKRTKLAIGLTLTATIGASQIMLPSISYAQNASRSNTSARAASPSEALKQAVASQVLRNLILLNANGLYNGDWNSREFERHYRGRFDNSILLSSLTVGTVVGLAVAVKMVSYASDQDSGADSAASALALAAPQIIGGSFALPGYALEQLHAEQKLLMASDVQKLAESGSQIAADIFDLSAQQKQLIRADLVREISLNRKADLSQILQKRGMITAAEGRVLRDGFMVAATGDRLPLTFSDLVEGLKTTSQALRDAAENTQNRASETIETLRPKLLDASSDSQTLLTRVSLLNR